MIFAGCALASATASFVRRELFSLCSRSRAGSFAPLVSGPASDAPAASAASSSGGVSGCLGGGHCLAIALAREGDPRAFAASRAVAVAASFAAAASASFSASRR